MSILCVGESCCCWSVVILAVEGEGGKRGVSIAWEYGPIFAGAQELWDWTCRPFRIVLPEEVLDGKNIVRDRLTSIPVGSIAASVTREGGSGRPGGQRCVA